MAWAFLFWSTTSIAFDQPLSVDQAFHLSGYLKNTQELALDWEIAPGYYLYAERFKIHVLTSNTDLKKITFPSSTLKQSKTGPYPVFNDHLHLDIPFDHPEHLETLLLDVSYQGCSENHFCYPPQVKQLSFNLQNQPGVVVQATPLESLPQKVSTQDKISNLFVDRSPLLILISFFGFGLLLSLTPCVLPMIPILSSLIIGNRKTITSFSAFALSLTYVLGMSITYAVIGVISALAGHSVQSMMQKPIFIGMLSGLFLLLALSLFGLYDIRIPSRFTRKIEDLSHQQKSSSYLGAIIMGILGSLIVSPCVTPPLIGALAYIANTGHILFGGLALFTLGIGMGIPLILIGTSYAKWLPQSGEWMNTVKSFFGILLIAMAIWLLDRVVAPIATMWLWSIFLIILSGYLINSYTQKPSKRWNPLYLGIGFLLGIYGILLLVGASMGHIDPLKPLNESHRVFNHELSTNKNDILFKPIETNADLDKALLESTQQSRITLLDFYADWCIACNSMDKHVFKDPTVQKKLSELHLIRADVTHNNQNDKALQKRFQIAGPPVILFFDTHGQELINFRLVGEIEKNDFLKHLDELIEMTKHRSFESI